MLRQYLAAGAQGDAAPSCESSIARHQGRGFRPAGTHRSLHAASQVALSGRTAWRVERPRAELRALDDFLKDKTSFDFAISIGTLVFTASQALQGWASYQQSLRDSESPA